MSAAANDLDRVCAWCKKDMGKTKSDQTGKTHGICEECLEKMTKEPFPNDLTMTRAERAEAAKADYGSAKNASGPKVGDLVSFPEHDGKVLKIHTVSGDYVEAGDAGMSKSSLKEDGAGHWVYHGKVSGGI